MSRLHEPPKRHSEPRLQRRTGTPHPVALRPGLAPASESASYALPVVAICAAPFVVAGIITFYALLRFRARREEDDREPPQVYASSQIESSWTVIPIGIVVLLALVTARTILVLQEDASATHFSASTHALSGPLYDPGSPPKRAEPRFDPRYLPIDPTNGASPCTT